MGPHDSSMRTTAKSEHETDELEDEADELEFETDGGTDDGDRVRVHVYVSGTVQGVYYRANTRDAARERGVDGWVRNLDDGRVEAVFEGAESVVESMVEWCHTGSPAAEVTGVDVEHEEPEGIEGFTIRY